MTAANKAEEGRYIHACPRCLCGERRVGNFGLPRVWMLSVRQTPRGELWSAYGVNDLLVLHWQSLERPTIVSPTRNPNTMKLSLGLGKIVITRGWLLGGCGWRGLCTVLKGGKTKKEMKFCKKKIKILSKCLQL